MKNWILYEDNHLIIVNKPPKIPVQGDRTGDLSLIDIAKKYIKERDKKPGNVFMGLPHRIDRPTSGIVVLSKTSKSLSRMTKIFKERRVKKVYWAIVKKKLHKDQATLINFLKKNQIKNKSFASKDKKNGFLKSELNYHFKQKIDSYYLYEVELITGRHHQIRAQFSYAGSPIKGDVKYGANAPNKNGSIHLHSRNIEFKHPVNDKTINITASPPKKEIIWRNCFKN
mgnify:FL=1|tara:strand:- start:2432 stop:3112 length:681 start_codon:yes stop_codon:yes gene_type:complete